MGDYLKQPNKGKEVQAAPIDENALVEKITKGIIENLNVNINQTIIGSQEQAGKVDDFDDSESLEALAQSMTTQRGKSKANFEDLGRTKETEVDEEQNKKTLDLLKNIDD